MKKNNNICGIVYSTDCGEVCPKCTKPISECKCKNNKDLSLTETDGIVRIARQSKGRKGKGVCIITGLPIPEDEIRLLASKLKSKCGTGGTVKDRTIEIQGDCRDKLKSELEKLGYKVKIAGG